MGPSASVLALALTVGVTVGACSTTEEPQKLSTFSVTSPDLADGKPFPDDNYANTFGCTGANRALRLAWSGAPTGTKSFAVTIHDVDAPRTAASGTG